MTENRQSIDAAIKAGSEAISEFSLPPSSPPFTHAHLAEDVIRAAVESGHLIPRDQLEQVGWETVAPGIVTDGHLYREREVVQGTAPVRIEDRPVFRLREKEQQ